MPSSTSSSSLRSRGIACLVATGLGVGLTIGADELTHAAHVRACERATVAVLDGEPRDSIRAVATDAAFARSVLARAPQEAIAFVGNSVTQTTIVPPILTEEFGTEREVIVFAPAGAATLTPLTAIARSAWRPAVLVVDVSPRAFGPPQRRLLGRIVDGEPPDKRAIQARVVATIEDALGATVDGRFPTLRPTRTPSEHFRGVRDGLRHGFTAYRSASWGNVFGLAMWDGSVRTTLLNTTPGYERFRRMKLAGSKQRLRGGDERADATLDRIAQLSERLAREGTRVVVVNMPLDPALREIDERVNGARYVRLAERLDAHPDTAFLDLGADPELAALPFYDGHHREYPVARTASARIAALLRPFVR